MEKDYPILFVEKYECCGCSACYAISMQPDEEGFLYPVVDKEKCVKCNACIKVCMFNKDIRLMTDK